MKIIAKIKDYYDYVGKIYGEDEKIVYTRLDLTDSEFQNLVIEAPELTKNLKLKPMRGDYPIRSGHQLIVAGHVFTVERQDYTNDHYKLITPEHYAQLSRHNIDYMNGEVKNFYKGEYLEEAAQLCKLVGQPVVVFMGNTHKDALQFYRRIPNLGDAGIAPFFEPEELFQKIQQFISNVLRECPDSQPAVMATDKDKIVAHGFDLVQSFRHRKV